MPFRLAVLIIGISICSASVTARDVRVFAAASLSGVLSEVAQSLQHSQGVSLKLVIAGSSTLARQIEAGADADIFISADDLWMDYLAGRKRVAVWGRRQLLSNSLVVVADKTKALQLKLTASADWLGQLGAGRIAMGDPEHVPVGRYGRAALQGLGAWARVRPRLAPALDTRVALALVERGEAIAGIVYATDAAASDLVQVVGRFPAASHPPIVYPIAIMGKARDGVVRRAYDFICGPKAAAIFKRHGFGIK